LHRFQKIRKNVNEERIRENEDEMTKLVRDDLQNSSEIFMSKEQVKIDELKKKNRRKEATQSYPV